ncbi:WbqC family protein [Winogradskyella aurantiaca]|uniref:WbqC family protein n=1 Tax=Winogradskyella aurantiaca TaxID=2219558 RepID=UPI000E1E2A39|nr:WbqC family protein [Winogradskyella aurantiaca]
MGVLLTPCYFGSISFWTALLSNHEVFFEIWGSYQKQTLRNRSNILGANGKLGLTIPVNYSQKNRQLLKDVQIANTSNWQELHLKSLASAYQMSPFYEYYIDAIIELFDEKWDSLLELNLATIRCVLNCLDLDLGYHLTTHFEKSPENSQDLRYLAGKNAPSPFILKSYTQVFSQKFGFTEELSILDLLFNEGPNTENILLSQLNG